jgi:ABC-type bacteriocin/lantibiotic exporter with double-glycine peptidase domain
MTIADTMLATMMFDRIKGPINRIPNIFNNTVEMNDSVERVQDFLLSPEK